MSDRGHHVIASYPRETIDFLPFRGLTVDGATPVATEVEYAVIPEYARPTGWLPAVVDDTGTPGLTLNGPLLGRGVFKVFARVGTVVIELGSFRLT